jgi:hypothetical protein
MTQDVYMGRRVTSRAGTDTLHHALGEIGS